MTSDKDGNYTQAYTYGLDRISVDNLASDETTKRDPLYYMYEGRGSVAQLTNSLGQVKDKYSYDPFGNTNHGGPLGNSEAHFQSFFGFNGEEYNNISGLQYLRARYYEAGTGRFLTRDSYLGSLDEPLSLNRYAYTSNNPVMNIDPSGHRRLSMTGEEEYDLASSSSSYGMLRNGSSGSDVTKLQQLLNNAGFNPGTIDGIFGNNTERAVRAYQNSKGLAVDGIVGNQTWGSLLSGGTSSSSSSSSSSLPSEILRKGSSGSAVQKLQQSLIDLGYDLGSYGADGAFGNKTEQAVINYQRDHGLLVDGVVGSQTWGALLGTSSLADRSRRDRCAGTDYIDGQGTGKTSESTTSLREPSSIINTAIKDAKALLDIMLNKFYPHEWPGAYSIGEYTMSELYKSLYQKEVNKAAFIASFFDTADLAKTIKESYEKAVEASGGYLPAVAVGTIIFTAMDVAYNEEPGIDDIPDALGINSVLNKNMAKALEKSHFIDNSNYKYLIYSGQFLWEKGPRGKFIDNITSMLNKINNTSYSRYGSRAENNVYKQALISYLGTIKDMNINYKQSVSEMNYYLKKIDYKYQ